MTPSEGVAVVHSATTPWFRRLLRIVGGRSLVALMVLTAGVAVTITVILAPNPASADTYDSTVLADHPVAFWDLNTPRSGFEADLTGNHHTATYRGGTPTLITMPNGNQAANFNGNKEYATVPSSSAFSIPTTHELTWEGWIRPNGLQFSRTNDTERYHYVDWMGKCQKYDPTCEWEARMYSARNPQRRCSRLSAYVFNPSAGLGSAADWQPRCGVIHRRHWLYVVGEYQTLTTPTQCSSRFPGTINIWVNGVKQDFTFHEPTGCMSEHGITPKSNSSPLDIGTMALETWFPGGIGKVAIYDSLLTQTQINQHFHAMTGATSSGTCQVSCTFGPKRSA